MDEKIKETLQKQLELLSECSQNIREYYEGRSYLSDISNVMVEIAKAIALYQANSKHS